jgi:GNAT superfamily N-acetyltransferase
MSLHFAELTHEQWYALEKPWWAADPCSVFEGSMWRIYPFYGATLFGGWLGDELVTVNATRFSKGKKKNAWGRYTNFYLAYTVPSHRRRGYAVALQRHVEELAVGLGYHRLKSLTQSYLGLRLHMSLGHHFWGVNAKNEIIVDTPLVAKDWPTDTVPMEARAVKDPHLLSEGELVNILRKPPFEMAVPEIVFTEGKLEYRELVCAA